MATLATLATRRLGLARRAARRGGAWRAASSSPPTNKETFLGGREKREDTKDDVALSEAEVEAVEAVMHPDKGQTKVDQYAFAIEMSEQEMRYRVNIKSLGDNGFFTNLGWVDGSVFATPDVCFSWSPTSLEELTLEHFVAAEVLSPPVDLLIIGTGEFTRQLSPELKSALRKIAPVEVCSSYNACATFNLMNAEDRRVAAAILAVEGYENRK